MKENFKKKRFKKIIAIIMICMISVVFTPIMPFVNGEAKADTQEEVEYLYPVYETEGTAASGIKEWKTGKIGGKSGPVYTLVEASDAGVTWGTAGQDTWYVVNGGTSEDPIKINGTATCSGK